MTGRVPSAFSRARFTERSSTVLFQVGSSCAAAALHGHAAQRPCGSPHIAGSFSMAIGSLWPHQIAIDGWWPSRSTAAGGLAHGLLADAAGVAPLQREVLPEQQPGVVGGVVELGPGDVGVDAQEVEAGVAARASTSRASSSGVASASAMRVGPVVGALEEQPLAVDAGDPGPHAHLAQPGAEAALVGGAAALVGVERAPARARSCRVGVAERPRPPQGGSVDGERPLDLVRAGGERLVGLVVDAAERGVQADRAGARRCRASARSTSTARSAVASRHSTRRRAMRTGPGLGDAHRAPDAARVPVGVEAVPVLEHAGDVALGGQVGRRGAGDLDGEVVLAAGAQRVGDLEGVRDEVALGVAEVGAVEPHVALVEEPVEGEPGRGAPRPAPCASNERR